MASARAMKIVKASGKTEAFDPDKFRQSLRRAGADDDTIEEVLADLSASLRPFTSTREIYRLARQLLRKRSRTCGVRYSLKKALFHLGPTGYPFEHYIADIFKNYGYRTKVGLTLQGRCVQHEVDVLAVDKSDISVMEVKFRNDKDKTVDVKVAMYVLSRMNDLEPGLDREYPGRKYSGWLVTNTRCTSDAVQFAECSGLKILSWRYPDRNGLEQMIEKKKLYPVTIISGIKAGLAEKLIKNRILMVKDLLSVDSATLRSLLSMSEKKAVALKKQAAALCE